MNYEYSYFLMFKINHEYSKMSFVHFYLPQGGGGGGGGGDCHTITLGPLRNVRIMAAVQRLKLN